MDAATPHQTKPAHAQGWGPVATIILTVLAFVMGQMAAIVVLLTFASLAGHGFDELAGENSILDKTGYIFLSNLLVSGLIFAATYLFVRLGHGNLRSIGLKMLRIKDAGNALIGYLVYFMSYMAITVIVHSAAPHWLDQNQELGFSRNAEGLALLPIFISLVILPPLMEEILFRGFLYTGLRRRLTIMWSTIITSGMFAAAHLMGGETSALLWIAAIDTFILSLVLCQLRERTGSLWPPILLHALKNFVAFGALFIFKIN